MKPEFNAVAVMVVALLFSSLANADPVMNEIDAANKAFAGAIMSKDIDYLVNDYTAAGCIIAPQAPKTCGREAIRAFWEGVIASNPKNVELITHTAEREADVAYATGELVITDAEPATHKSQFVLVFKKVGAAWKLHIDSWTPR